MGDFLLDSGILILQLPELTVYQTDDAGKMTLWQR